MDSLDLSGAVISIDAMGTQTNIAEQIVQSEADYILSLKGNQKHLYEDVQDCFTGQYTCHRYETLDIVMTLKSIYFYKQFVFILLNTCIIL